MSFDFSETLKTIIDNEDALIAQNMSIQDLKNLGESLRIAKNQIRLQIVSDMMRGDQSIPTQIADTKTSLEGRITRLQMQEQELQAQLVYPEFSEPNIPDTVPEHLRKAIITQRRIEYDKDKARWEDENRRAISMIKTKIEMLKGKIVELQDCVTKLDNPQAFIEEFLKDAENRLTTSPKYVELLKTCATIMDPHQTYYPQGKNNYVGLTSEERQQSGPLFDFDDEKGTFTINPTSLSLFLDRVRDPELITQLDEYRGLQGEETSKRTGLEQTEKQVQDAEALKSTLDDTETCEELETFIKELVTHIDAYRKAKYQIGANNQSTELIKAPRNPIVRLFNNIFAKAKIAAAEKKATEENKVLAEESKSHVTAASKLLQEHSKRLAESPQYKMAYDAYIKASPKINITSPRYIYDDRNAWRIFSEREIAGTQIPDSQLIYTASLVALARNAADSRSKSEEEATPMINLVVQKLKPEEILRYATSRRDAAKNLYEKAQQSRESAEKRLSPEAKMLLDQGINTLGLRRHYVDKEGLTERGSLKVTPFMASLAMEALLKAGNIRTIEEAQQLGIEITSEDIEEYRQNGIENLTKKIEKISKTGQDLEDAR